MTSMAGMWDHQAARLQPGRLLPARVVLNALRLDVLRRAFICPPWNIEFCHLPEMHGNNNNVQLHCCFICYSLVGLRKEL